MKSSYEELFRKYELYVGRMISAHKTAPKGCLCVWNANVVSPTQGKVWYGDLNITKEGKVLKKIADELGETLYVLREMDCRFGTAADEIDVLMFKAVWDTTQEPTKLRELNLTLQ